MNDDDDLKLNRRRALKLIASTAASVPVVACSTQDRSPTQQVQPPAAEKTVPAQSLSDPDMLNPVVPWSLVLTDSELRTLKVLCDLIIPADDVSPSAGALGAQDYINEYVSAPYEHCRQDLIKVRGGIVWIDSESQRRFDKTFAALEPQWQTAICDDIKWEQSARAQYKTGAGFFAKVRDLTATAFYTTEQGMADIGYVGNKPLAAFEGPPDEVLKKLGLA
ncbi:MAG: gluconate 2-dehydrogenase subunit 3 family protein [Exilibacterium sp.]